MFASPANYREPTVEVRWKAGASQASIDTAIGYCKETHRRIVTFFEKLFPAEEHELMYAFVDEIYEFQEESLKVNRYQLPIIWIKNPMLAFRIPWRPSFMVVKDIWDNYGKHSSCEIEFVRSRVFAAWPSIMKAILDYQSPSDRLPRIWTLNTLGSPGKPQPKLTRQDYISLVNSVYE